MLLPDCKADHRQHQLQAVSQLLTHCPHTPLSQNFSLPSLAPLTFVPALCFGNCLVWSMPFCPFFLYERGNDNVYVQILGCMLQKSSSGWFEQK